MDRPDIPKILPMKQGRPNLYRALAAGLRHADRPWSIGLDILLLGLLLGLMGWEGFYEFPQDFELPHLLAAIGALGAAALHGMRAFTSPDREDHDR